MIKNLDVFISEIAFRSSRFEKDFFFSLDYKLLENLPDGGRRYFLRGTLSSCISEFRDVLIFDTEDEFKDDKKVKFEYVQKVLHKDYGIGSVLEENGLKVISLMKQVKDKLNKY